MSILDCDQSVMVVEKAVIIATFQLKEQASGGVDVEQTLLDGVDTIKLAATLLLIIKPLVPPNERVKLMSMIERFKIIIEDDGINTIDW